MAPSRRAWRRAGESLLGEPPGEFGGDRGLIVVGALVGLAVEHGVERGLLGSDHVPQVLVDGALGDGDVVVDRAVLADAVQPFFHLLGFAGRPGLFGLDAEPRGGEGVADTAGADRHRDDRGLRRGLLLERGLGCFFLGDASGRLAVSARRTSAA